MSAGGVVMRARRLFPAVSLSLLSTPIAFAQTPPPISTTGGIALGLSPLATFSGGPPLALDYAPDSTDRLFIAGQTNGQVQILQSGALQATPFFNVSTAGITLSQGSEKGLLGMAFHPNFAGAAGTPGAGKFYTFTSEPKGASTTGVDFIHPELVSSNLGDCDSVIREWSVDPANPNVVNTAAGSRVVMRIRKPQSNHNGGELRFGPDGYLYLSIGDGGGGNDFNGSAGSTTDGHTNSSGNAQDVTQIYGKILRIDPVDPALNPASTDPISPNGKYREPQSNPFAGATAGLDEIFAYGLRNPWRFSFDRGGTHQLFAGDVGQTLREEVDIVTNGGNYGWVYKEGTLANAGSGRTDPGNIPFIAPIAEYTHADGQAIIGGYVYRGQNIPELYGKYVFGELGFGSPSAGRIFYTDTVGGTIQEFNYALNAPAAQLYSFGEDRNGELYALFANGSITQLLGRQWLTDGGGSWNATGNWLLASGETVPNTTGASANFFGQLKTAGSAPATVTIDGNKTVGALRFNNALSYSVQPGTGGTITLDNGAGVASLVQVISGNHTINVPIAIPAGRNSTIDVAAGSTLTLGGALAAGANLQITKTGGGTLLAKGLVSFDVGVAVTALSVNGGNFVLAPGAPTAQLKSLNFAGSGRLDLTSGAVVVTSPIGSWNGSTYTAVTGQIQSGRAGGNWSGTGIVTSQTTATTSNLTSIGVATGAQVKGITGSQTAVWNGATVGSGSTLVMYTYGGDANLDGKINVDDYTRIDFNVPLGSHGWFNGDFNYDGKINVDDYTIIDFNVGIQGPPLGGFAEPAFSAVPEPASLCLLLPAIALTTRRCRRRIPRLR
jgi:hypothetical protein